MNTNLLCIVTVALVTNVVTGDNARGCRFRNHVTDLGNGLFSSTLLFHPFHEGCTPFVEPTERWTITNVTRVSTLRFDWMGARAIEHTELLSSVTNREVMVGRWEEKR